MPRYNVMEAYPDGSLHDTGKVVLASDKDLAKKEVFELYGFKGSGYHSYYISAYVGTSVHIRTTFANLSGYQDVWVLKQDDETKESEDDDANS